MPNIRIDRPVANDLLVIGTTCHVAGLITGDGGPEPVHLDSVTVQVGDQPPVGVTFAPVITHPPQKVPTYTFQADVQVSGPAGPTTVVLSARFDSGNDLTASRPITTRVATATPALQKITMTFNTHGDNKDHDTVLHVFVKNRTVDTFRANNAGDYVSNLASFQSHEVAGTSEINPYLGFAQDLGHNTEFGDPSSHTFDIPLRGQPILIEEVILPVVNIHILPNGNDTWIFDYTITFVFDNGKSFSSASNRDGITGIILDQDNRNYVGICVENPLVPLPPLYRFQSSAVLQQVCLEFNTEDDDANKDGDTVLNVHIVNRLSATTSQDIAVANNLLPGQAFDEKSTHRVTFGPGGLPLASNAIRLQEIILPLVFINIAPNGSDRWRFNYRVSYTFSDGRTFTSSHSGIVLDQDRHKHVGVYQGGAFPNTITPPGKPPANLADHRSITKSIPLDYLRQRFDEFINNRQGLPGQDPPIQTLRLGNTGGFGQAQPESFFDLQSLVANPPAPGVLSPPGFQEDTRFNSNPTSVGQLDFGFSFNTINTKTLTFTVNAGDRYPLAIVLEFDCHSANELLGPHGMSLKSFHIRILLSLDYDAKKKRVDVLSWVDTITDDDQIANFLQVIVVSEHATDFGGSFQKHMRQKIYDRLTQADPYDGKTMRDKLNETVNSWLLGGVVAGTLDTPCGGADTDGCVVSAAEVNATTGNLDITYTRQGRFFALQNPPDWPTATKPNPAHDFSPGNLANIDHIVVLTMENRSFDTMLGYLSLPPERGGQGRKDVDGLKGGEVNRLRNGQVCPSFAYVPLDTIMTPDPPHSPEPVHRAIDGGKMDGFAQSYADERGNVVAPRIMGYQTAVNVPVYDALARDFALGHRWFASHPGPTFCNRFYELTGMLNVDPEGFWEFENSSPLRPVFTPTIFDYLTAQGVSWTYFEHHYCFLRFFQNYTFDNQHIRAFDDPIFGFLNLARQSALPSVSFIDPHFVELPPGATCDGPPADVQAGQQFVKRVVEAVVSSPLWNKTLLLIIYDEHGGFYDHVAPPAAVQVVPGTNLPTTYGVRVPAFVISPWVKAGSVFGHDAADSSPSLYFDHTSILKTIARRFLSQNPPYMGARYAAANDLSSVVGNTMRPVTGRLRPFLPYRLTWGGAPGGIRTLGPLTTITPGGRVALRPDPGPGVPNPADLQAFCLEDRPDETFRIRTRVGWLYLTAQPDGSVILDISRVAAAGDAQVWTLIEELPTLDTPYRLICPAFPGLVLRPGTDPANPSVVGLGPPVGQPDSHGRPAWWITSPLLAAGGDGTL